MRLADELFAEADRLEELGDQQGALRVWRELVDRYPDPVAENLREVEIPA